MWNPGLTVIFSLSDVARQRFAARLAELEEFTGWRVVNAHAHQGALGPGVVQPVTGRLQAPEGHPSTSMNGRLCWNWPVGWKSSG